MIIFREISLMKQSLHGPGEIFALKFNDMACDEAERSAGVGLRSNGLNVI